MTDYDTIYREGYEEGVAEMKSVMEKMKAEMEKLKKEKEEVINTCLRWQEKADFNLTDSEEEEESDDEEEDEEEEECVPRCDYCKVTEEDIRYYQGGDMWNGDTGCCVACEKKHDC